LLAAAVAALVLALPAAAAADELQVFELAKTRFDAGQYEEAASRFAAMLDPANPPCEKGPTDPGGAPCRITDADLIERARALAAASLIALGRGGEAEPHIERLLLSNPAYTPNPALFQPEVIDRFTAVRARIREQIEATAKRKADQERAKRLAAQRAREAERRWIAGLQRLAAEERVVEKRSRWIAALPFGIGQFQNGDTGLGWAFLVSQALAGATTIVSAIVVGGYEGVDVTPEPTPTAPGEERQDVDIDALNSQIQTATTINRVAFGAWAALTAVGIVHAQVTFVPDRVTVRTRPVPPPPPSFSAGPTVSVMPGGVGLGVTGRF
jgi:hypothetical protein